MFVKYVRFFLALVFAFFINITSNIHAESCACVNLEGCCLCPKDHCACESDHGKCECHAESAKHENKLDLTNYDDSNETSKLSDCNQQISSSCSINPMKQHQLFIGPEVYYLHRNRKGSKQNGWIYGGRIGYERIKRCRLYFGVEGLYTAKGNLKGHTGENKVRIQFQDKNIEGRFGYTFQQKAGLLATVIPFVGYGYTEEVSFLKRPINFYQKSRLTYDYFAAGFITQIYPHKNFVLGLNFKARFLFNSKSKVSHIPEGSFTHHFQHCAQYRAELPLTYRLTPECDRFAVSLVPFYEYRHYGTQFGTPFDFIDTKFNFYGFDVRFMYLF